eukprot:TRINITY_DN12143_c0_g1_i1.p2 TRINITY_DN12143_c0_g1~~TRINITY_DN12143_c0_g1_i1.p2  ORF type:complete len:112 (-),score=23.21 TRINITY_DN12143_c0_g1_i1:142-477(-)
MNPSGGAGAGAGSGASSTGGAFAMFRSMSLKAGAAIKDGYGRTSEAVREGTKNMNIQKFGHQAGETFNALCDIMAGLITGAFGEPADLEQQINKCKMKKKRIKKKQKQKKK